MKIDFISDIHIDFYVSINSPVDQQAKVIKKFVETLLPPIPAKYIIVAGDIGHFDKQNLVFMSRLSKIYDKVFYTYGNHDLYLIYETEKELNNRDSMNRTKFLSDETKKFGNVFFLDGDVVQVDDKFFGGFPVWYDGTYGKYFHGLMDFVLDRIWKSCINDHRYIFLNGKNVGLMRIIESLFVEQYKRLLDNVEQCDLIFSHVPPSWSHIKPPYQDPTSSFFCFDGQKAIEKCSGKSWIFGHTHVELDYVLGDCHFLCNPLGYPLERKNIKIKSIEI